MIEVLLFTSARTLFLMWCATGLAHRMPYSPVPNKVGGCNNLGSLENIGKILSIFFKISLERGVRPRKIDCRNSVTRARLSKWCAFMLFFFKIPAFSNFIFVLYTFPINCINLKLKWFFFNCIWYIYDPEEKFLPSILEDVEKSPHNITFSPTAQTAKNVGFTIACSECSKPRLLHSKNKVKKDDIKGVKRMLSKLSYMCGNDRDAKHLNSIYVRESISCSIELPYYSVDHFPKICIYCGIAGTTRTLGDSVECYPKCIECKEKPDVNRRKRKSLVESDLKEEVNIWYFMIQLFGFILLFCSILFCLDQLDIRKRFFYWRKHLIFVDTTFLLFHFIQFWH